MIYLLRHTAPKIDPGVCYGESDVDLHEDFHEIHLPSVLKKVEELEFDKIYCSPKIRCRKLADAIAHNIGFDSISDDSRLKEMNFGDWELVKWSDIYNDPKSKIWFDNFLIQPTVNGESFLDIVERAKSFLMDIKEEAQRSNILVVSHSGFIRALIVVSAVINFDSAFDLVVDYGDIISLEV